MPYWNFRGSRESKTLHSEKYKEVIVNYFRAKGYRKMADSSIEGCLTDLVLKNPELDGDTETHIEAKWDDFSLNNIYILNEFISYLLLYFRISEDQRFKFYIFCRNVQNVPLHRNIFERYREDTIALICEKIKTQLSKDNLNFFNKIDFQEILSFFTSSVLVQANVNDLKMKIFQILGEYPTEKNIFLRFQKLEDKDKLVNEKDELLSNLIELKQLSVLWRAKTDWSFEEIIDQIRHPPPFYLYEGYLISLYSFFDKYNSLKASIDESTIQKINLNRWVQDINRRNVIIALLNRTIRRIARLRGLYKKPDSNTFYFPNFRMKREERMPWIIYEHENGQLIKNKSRRLIFKKYAEKSRNPYYLHIAVEINACFTDNNVFFSFFPRKVYTSDGINLVSPERAKELDEQYRTPEFTRNRELLLQQLFWGYIFFFRKEKPIDAFYKEKAQEIYFHTKKILDILGISYFKSFVLDKKPRIQGIIS